MLHEWLVELSEIIVPLINLIALVFITYGVTEAALKGLSTIFMAQDPLRFRLIWMRFARWLIAGLTFQLAADIVETSVAPTWDEIGRLAAIAVVRTFLNYFLEKDQREARELVNDGPRTNGSGKE